MYIEDDLIEEGQNVYYILYFIIF